MKIICNWCGDPITAGQFVRVARGDKRFYFHNRHCNDCYVDWTEEEEYEKEKKSGEIKKRK
jgi:ribosomal protein L24E